MIGDQKNSIANIVVTKNFQSSQDWQLRFFNRHKVGNQFFSIAAFDYCKVYDNQNKSILVTRKPTPNNPKVPYFQSPQDWQLRFFNRHKVANQFFSIAAFDYCKVYDNQNKSILVTRKPTPNNPKVPLT
jgi:hypothetical protein